jgi:hypothetical protein
LVVAKGGNVGRQVELIGFSIGWGEDNSGY